MQMQMRERMMAQQLAMARERLYWWGAFYTLAFVGLTRGYVLDDVIWYMLYSGCCVQGNGEEAAMDYGSSCTPHICGGLPGRSCIWKQDAACRWSVTESSLCIVYT